MIARRPAAALAAAVSLIPVLGLFTATRVFYVRDLSFFFWSRHLWLRHTVFSGQWPWWDPYLAGGQSAIADALNQLAMPITLAIRLVPSDVVSFNLWVALPLPVAAVGMFVFLTRRLVPAAQERAAVFGALLFALSGPIVSMLNTPNLAWSVALVPWVLAAAETRWQLVAIAFALQGLCGEPVTWAATAVIVAAHGAVQRRLRPLAGLFAGALLAAVQLVPTITASVHAHRDAAATPDFWSLHPLSLWEALAPHLFGNYYDASLNDLPWMAALNFGRDPFFYSLYLGPLVLLLAAIGAARGRRNLFWVGVALAFTVAAMGGYTPAYPALRRLLPWLLYFRFPVKYIVFAVFAIAVLAADGWREVPPDTRRFRALAQWLPTGAGACTILMALWLIATPAALHRWTYSLALATHLKDPAGGADALARGAPLLALRAGVMLLVGALLATLARPRPWAWPLLAVIACVDLLATNAGLNPTLDASRLSPPGWFTAAAGAQRVYIGGRVRGYMNTDDPDGADTWELPGGTVVNAGRAEINAELPLAPSGWGVREALSYDLPFLWPAEYEAVVGRFEGASLEERDAFLRRAAVRWCVVRASPPRSWRPLTDVGHWDMRVYECNPAASRVTVVLDVPSADALFDPAGADPPPVGDARIVEDGSTRVSVEASAGRPAFLVLRDSYDPSWRAELDGSPAPIVRAYGLYRAVALPPGRHVIRFSYRPRDLLRGLSLTVAAVLLIGFSGFFRFSGFSGFRFSGFRFSGFRFARFRFSGFRLRRGTGPRASGERGFTLIELMVVLAIIAIVMSIAFTQYRNMQARGNEVSALSSLRSIAAAQWQFATTCGNMKYATTLPGLGQPAPATGVAFLSPDLTSADTLEKSGYTIRMAGKPLNDAPPACNGAAVAEGYAATADPLKPRVSGAYFYGVNADRVLYLDQEKSFKEDLPESGNAVHGAEVK